MNAMLLAFLRIKFIRMIPARLNNWRTVGVHERNLVAVMEMNFDTSPVETI